ncbi:YbaK/EbsC family protein [Lacticaseibacillus pantheris]|nr:YbaK/EbsC family protein [Lacticaseibacillus pantheris]
MTLPEQYLQRLDSLQVKYRVIQHAPVRRMLDDQEAAFAGVIVVKNILFSVDGKLVLVLQDDQNRVDVHTLASVMGVSRSRVRMATNEELAAAMGVAPGLVSPLVLAEDTPVRVIISRQLTGRSALGFHFGDPARTAVISSADLLRFLRNLGVEPQITSIDGTKVQEG